MTNLTLLVATAISLLAAAPAIAMPHHHHRGYAYSRAYTSSNYSGDFDRQNTFN